MLHPPAQRVELAEAYAHCRRLARGHYENFTVVSWLLPKALRPSMYAVYAFCRHTDDLGDEATGDRLALLDAWEQDFRRCYGGDPRDAVLVALQDAIRRHAIPSQPFLDLIEANRMDQRITRYETYGALLEYCRHSANSVGRMVLSVFGYADPARRALSDATCTALQLANFWQDVRRDYAKGRIYIPLEDMRRVGYTEEQLARGECNGAFRSLIAYEIGRTRRLFVEGAGLVDMVSPSLRLDLRLFTKGGEAVLDAIEAHSYNVLAARPRVSKVSKARLALYGLVQLALSGRSRG